MMFTHYCFAQRHVGRICFLGEDTAALEYPCMDQMRTVEDSIAETTLQTLIRPLGLYAQFSLRGCDEIRNFASLISERNSARYILYNKTAIDSIADATHRNWDKIAIYLHELAHHLNGNTSNPSDENPQEQELRADEFSGMQMAKLTAKLPQAQKYLTMVPNPPCDDDANYAHPCLEKRLDAVAKGWYSGMGLESFYRSVSSRKFETSVKPNESDFPLSPEPFFSYKHCVRSDSLCNCSVVLNKIKFEIDYQHRKCSLALNLIDADCSKCGHATLDTTVIARGIFQLPWDLMPEQKMWIDFDMYPSYSEKLRFNGRLSSGGVIEGDLIIPNDGGGCWGPPGDYKDRYITRVTLNAR